MCSFEQFCETVVGQFGYDNELRVDPVKSILGSEVTAAVTHRGVACVCLCPFLINHSEASVSGTDLTLRFSTFGFPLISNFDSTKILYTVAKFKIGLPIVRFKGRSEISRRMDPTSSIANSI